MTNTLIKNPSFFFNALLTMKYDEDGYPIEQEDWEGEELDDDTDDDLEELEEDELE